MGSSITWFSTYKCVERPVRPVSAGVGISAANFLGQHHISGHKGQNSIRGHKGRNPSGTRCRGFLALESQCRGFLVLASRCRGFLSSEKTPWNHDVVAYLSPFLDVVVFWSWDLDVVVFWPWNLDVAVFWSWDLDVVVCVSPRPRFRFHYENRKKTRKIILIILLKNISAIQIYATPISIMYA